MTKLPPAQHNLIRHWVLTGTIHKHSTRTVDALLNKGFLDCDGPTDKARQYVDHWELAFLRGEKS